MHKIKYTQWHFSIFLALKMFTHYFPFSKLYLNICVKRNYENKIWRSVIYSQWGARGLQHFIAMIIYCRQNTSLLHVRVATTVCWHFLPQSYKVYLPASLKFKMMLLYVKVFNVVHFAIKWSFLCNKLWECFGELKKVYN